MSQCSAGDEPPALVASPQCPPASKLQSSAAMQHILPLSHNPPDFFHPCGQCVKSSSYYSEHLQPLHHHWSVPSRIRLFVMLFFFSPLSKLLVHKPHSSWFFSYPLATDDHAVICPFQLLHAIFGAFGLVCSFDLLFEHLWCLPFALTCFIFSPSLDDFLAHSHFFPPVWLYSEVSASLPSGTLYPLAPCSDRCIIVPFCRVFLPQGNTLNRLSSWLMWCHAAMLFSAAFIVNKIHFLSISNVI